MPNEIIDQNKQSSSENLKKVPWVEKQTEEALNNLGEDAEKSFYVEDAEKHVVTYKIGVVKQYLSRLYDKVKDIENVREAWIKLVEEGNTSARIMAVQIALESLGKKEYDVGEIDGIFKTKGKETSKTMEAVKKFQEDNGLEPDGIPGKETIRVLLEKLEDQNEEKEVEDPYKDVKVKEGEIDVPSDRDVKAEDLVEKPEDITVEFGEGSSVDKTKEGEDQTVIVVVRKEGVDPRNIIVIVKIENGKMTVREEKEVEDPFKDVKIKEEIDKPADDKDVEAKDLVEGLPENADVKFKDDKGIDKTKEGEEQEVTVIVTIGDKTKEFVVLATVESNKIKLKDKEEKEKREEKEWFEDLKIDDLGTWNNDGNFSFKDGLIDEETGKLTVNDKEIQKLEEGGNGFGYFVMEGRLSIGNFENGVLNGNGVEFYPYGDEYREEGADSNLYGSKLQGVWENGKLKEGLQIVSENGLDVHFKIESGEAVKCYVDDESKSFDMEKTGDSLYLKNGKTDLKLKNKYSAAIILKILYDYKDKDGNFSTDLSEGLESKKLLRKSSDGKSEVVYHKVDNFIEASFGMEGSALSGWLNEYRETHKGFKLEEYGEFDNEGKFELKEKVEKTDENGKKYIEYNGEKYYEYEEGMNDKLYRIGPDYLYVGNFVNNIPEGHGITIWSDGTKYEGEWKNGAPEGKGTTIWGNGNKFEGERKDDKIEKGKFTIIKPEEMKGEYDVKRDDRGLRIVSGEHEGKYINYKEWKIEEKGEKKTEVKKEECEEVRTESGNIVNGVYYRKETKTYYKEVEGKLEEIKSRTGKPIVKFLIDKAHLEKGKNKYGRIAETYVDIDDKIISVTEYDSNGNLFKYSKYDDAGKLDYTNSFENGILFQQRNHKQGITFKFKKVKDLGDDKCVLQTGEYYYLYKKNNARLGEECDQDGNKPG